VSVSARRVQLAWHLSSEVADQYSSLEHCLDHPRDETPAQIVAGPTRLSLLAAPPRLGCASEINTRRSSLPWSRWWTMHGYACSIGLYSLTIVVAENVEYSGVVTVYSLQMQIKTSQHTLQAWWCHRCSRWLFWSVWWKISNHLDNLIPHKTVRPKIDSRYLHFCRELHLDVSNSSLNRLNLLLTSDCYNLQIVLLSIKQIADIK